MRPRKTVRRTRRLLILAGIAGALSVVGNWAHAVTTTAVTDVSPGAVKAESDRISIFGINMVTSNNPGLVDSFTGAQVQFNNVSGFSTGDLAGDVAAGDCENDATLCDGVQLWRDTVNDDVIGAGDVAVSTGFSFSGDCLSPITTCTATLVMGSQTLPQADEGYSYILAIKTSPTIGNDDTFNLTLAGNAFTTSPTPTVPTGTTQSQNIAGDVSAPSPPTVAGLGLSTSVGKVRVGGTAASTENPATLQVWRSSDGTCTGDLTFVTQGTQQNLTLTNRDLVGSTAAQTTALQGFPVNSQTVCYRVRDEAGNVSGFAADGLVPGAPATSDVALLGVSNVTGVKRVYASPDPAVASQGPRTFRIYIRPGGSSAPVERAKDESLTTNNLVEVTTALTTQTDSDTTDIRQYTSGTSLAADDGVAYTRVNANGNDGPVTNDGVVPAAAPGSVLALLSTSAVSDHQRVAAAADAGGPRQFALYVDTNGLTQWAPAVTSSGGSDTVRVTTSTSAATASATTNIFAGADGDIPLGSGDAIGYSLINSQGNQADVAADGTIPSDPIEDDITASDALNQFRVSPFPVGVPPLAVRVRLFVGSDADTAYATGGIADATSSAAVPVPDFAANAGVFYTAINTTTGNESDLIADGTIPSIPTQDNLNILHTSAADGHQRIVAAGSGGGVTTFRLYVDPSGGTTFLRANTLSGGNGSNVEVTSGASPSSSGTSSIFAGDTQLAGGHAVGYARTSGSSGNDSDVTAEGTIPAAPAASTLSVSDALNQMVATSASATNHVNLHVGLSGETATTAYSETGPDATAVDANAVSIADPDATAPLYYTASTPATGNESTTTSDGIVPSEPSGALALLSTSAAQGHQRVRSLADSSGTRTFRLYVDTAGGSGDRHRAVTTSGGSVPVEVTTDSTQPTTSPTTTIFAGPDGTTPLANGHAVSYAEVSTGGNDSDVAADGTIPAAPVATTTSATAATDEVTASASSATFNVAVFKSTSESASTAYSEGVDVTLDADQTKPLDTSSGDRLYYARIDTANGNESSLIADGSIPTKVDNTASSASDALQQIVAPGADPATPVDVFFHTTNTPADAYDDGPEYTMTASPFTAPTDLPAEFLFFTVRNLSSGNESEITSDGSVPAAPAGVDTALFASAATQQVQANPDSTARTVRMYGDPVGGIAWERATTTAEGGSFVEFTTSTGSQTQSAVGVFLGGSPLSAGATVAYSRILGGNESDLVTDGAIPAPPTGTGNFSADAAEQTATVASAAPTSIYRLFRGTTPASGRTVHSNGAATTIVASGLAAGEDVGYAQSNANGNESVILSDGTIPAVPTHVLQDASDSGLSQDDGITQDSTPTFDLTGTPTAAVLLYEGAIPLASGTFDVNGTVTLTTSTLTGGAHDIQSKQTVDGNTSPAAPIVTVTVDTTVPGTPAAPDLTSDTGLSSTDNITKTAEPELSVTTEAGAQVSLFEDLETDVLLDTATANGSGLAALTSDHLADGDHTFYVFVTDPAGNQSANSGTLTISIDTVAPTALGGSPDLQGDSDSGSSASDNVTNDATPTFDVTGADPEVLVGLLDGTNTMATGMTSAEGTVTLTAPTMSDGVHTIRSSSQDVAGNFGPLSPALTLTVDTAAPTAGTPDLSAASDLGRSTTDDVTNDSTPSLIVESEAGSTVEISEGATAVGSATTPESGTASVTTTALSDGAHTLTAKATDVAGNASALSSGIVVTIDTGVPTAPEAPDLQAESDTGSSSTDNITSDNTPTFDVSFAEPNGLVTLKSGETPLGTEIGTGSVAVTTAELSDGARTITATATDVAGNESPASTGLGVTIDAVAPAAPAVPDLVGASDSGTSSSDNITSDTTPTISLTGSETNLVLELFEGETSLGTVSTGGSTSGSLTTSELSEGAHTVFARATDESGKVSADGPSLVITVDTTAPTAVITVPTTLDGVGSVQFSEHVTPVGPSNVVIREDGSATNVPATVTYNATDHVATIRPTSPLIAAKTYDFIVAPGSSASQNDAAGNVIESTSAEFTTPVVAEETDAAVSQLWRNVRASKAYGSFYRFDHTAGASVKRTFTGTSITWYSLKNVHGGKAQVLIDGASKGTIDLYSSTSVYRFAKTYSGLSNGTHTIEVRVLGTKRSVAKDTRVAFDAFKVGSEKPTPLNVTYGWSRVLNGSASAGGYIRSDLLSASLTFAFTGTAVDLYTITGPSMGKAHLYIDGVRVTTIDNYSAATSFDVKRSLTGLTDEDHILRVVLTGSHHESSSGSMVAVDKIVVPV